jgi:S-adenosylmethionine:tRNA ribosyltransferase-isomerase
MTGQPKKAELVEDLRIADFNFDLPEELIAQQPPAERGLSRMLVVNRVTGTFEDSTFAALPSLLKPGDLLVLNDSRVIPARLYGRRTLLREHEPPGPPTAGLSRWGGESPGPPTAGLSRWGGESPGSPTAGLSRWGGQRPSGRIEVMLTEPAGENRWRALVRPGRKVAIGERLVFPTPTGEILLEAEVLEHGQFGERLLRFEPVEDFFAILDRIGHMPLPPYIHRDDSTSDRERYQTVFAQERGSVAAPTAGLHFTGDILQALTAKGAEVARITLHVGLGTFAPLRVERVKDVRLHRERYTLSEPTAQALNRAVAEGRRIVAVGTTVVRTLESIALQSKGGELKPHTGETETFISPGFQFRLVGALLTNFHLPQSSLLMLVSAFAGPERTGIHRVLAAYRHAVDARYRFFSYGDCMFVA